MGLALSKGVAAVQCSSYVKDKEEVARTAKPSALIFCPDREPTRTAVSLDEELAERRQSLQRSFNDAIEHAATRKQRGNQLLAAGCASDALEAYPEGEQALEVMTGHASILLSDVGRGAHARATCSTTRAAALKRASGTRRCTSSAVTELEAPARTHRGAPTHFPRPP